MTSPTKPYRESFYTSSPSDGRAEHLLVRRGEDLGPPPYLLQVLIGGSIFFSS